MKRFTKAGILMLGLALVSQIAQAQFAPNDLYVGFVGVGASSNYVINLGSAGTITGSPTVVNLSGDFSLSVFSSVFTGAYTNVSMGVVGGASGFTPDLYATAFRSGGAGIASVPGSDLSSFAHNSSILNGSANDLSVVGFPGTAGSDGVLGASDGDSWSLNVAPNFVAGSFYGDSGINPMSALDASGLLYEDLWMATSSSSYTYLGYFTFDAAGSTLTFTPQAVPEPASLSILGGGALLVWCLRWRAARGKAKRV